MCTALKFIWLLKMLEQLYISGLVVQTRVMLRLPARGARSSVRPLAKGFPGRPLEGSRGPSEAQVWT